MAKGLLVDDATMLDIIRDRVAQPDAQNGFILDGFPRTQTAGRSAHQAHDRSRHAARRGGAVRSGRRGAGAAHLRPAHLLAVQQGVQHPHRAAAQSRDGLRAGQRTSTSCSSARTTRKPPCAERLRVYARADRSPCCLTTRMRDCCARCAPKATLEEITQRLLDVLRPAATPRNRRGRKKRAAKRRAAAKPKAKARARKVRAPQGEAREAQAGSAQGAKKRGAHGRKRKAARKAKRARRAPVARASQSAANNCSPTTSLRQPRSRLTSRLPGGELFELAPRGEHFGADLEALRDFGRDVGQPLHQRELRRIGTFAARQRRRRIGDAGIAHQRQQFLAALAHHGLLHLGQRRERFGRTRQPQHDLAQARRRRGSSRAADCVRRRAVRARRRAPAPAAGVRDRAPAGP